MEWNDPRLQPVWERSNARPFAGFNPRAGFMQPAPGFNSGDYCWLDRGGDQPETDVLVCVQFVKGATARVWKATDGKWRDVDTQQLEHVEQMDQTQLWSNWAAAVQEAVIDRKNSRLIEWLPSTVVGLTACERSSRNQKPESSLRLSPFELGRGKTRKGNPESAFVVGDVPTPALAHKLDVNRERYEKMNKPFPMEWDVRSWEPQPPEEERSPGNNFMPILLAGALVAFVATR